MPTYIFDFNLEMWVQDVKIEAASYEEAKDKLLSMRPEEYLNDWDVTIKNDSITDIDCVVEDEEDDEDDDEEYDDVDELEEIDEIEEDE